MTHTLATDTLDIGYASGGPEDAGACDHEARVRSMARTRCTRRACS